MSTTREAAHRAGTTTGDSGTPSDADSTLRLLRPYLLRHWWSLVGALLCTVVATAASLAAPWPLKLAIDRLTGPAGAELAADDWWLLAGLALAVLLIALAGAVSSYFQDYWLNRSGERIVHALRVATYAQLQRLSLAFHARRHKGDLVTRVTGDVNAVGSLFADTLGTLASAVLTLVGMFVVCVLLDPLLTSVVFALALPLYLVIRRFQRAVKEAARRQRAKDGEIASLATEALTAMPVVKAFGTERFEHDRVERSSEARLAFGLEAIRLEARFGGLVDMIGALSTALILTLGVVSVVQGRISVGTLVVFVAYSGKLYKPLRDIARQSTRWARTMARLERIGEILRSDEVLEEGAAHTDQDRPRAAGELVLDGVSFRYGSDRWAVQDVDLHVAAGRTVAVVGTSGAGKSTIGALVARFYDPTCGRVLLDGTEARECSLGWLRQQVGVLQQDTILFSGTIRENIAYGRRAPAWRIAECAEKAGAAEFIADLPLGIDTPLGPGGSGLSGGQRQRVGIARVLLRDPPVLVLDEPTTGLDQQSERQVLEGLSSLMSGRTTLLITHSLLLARSADTVVFMSGGRIAQVGTAEHLLASSPAFRRLWATTPDPAPESSVAPVPPGPATRPPSEHPR